jgi:hypothetical protein
MQELFPRKTFLPQDEEIKNLPYPYNVCFTQRLGEDVNTEAENSAGSIKQPK